MRSRSCSSTDACGTVDSKHGHLSLSRFNHRLPWGQTHPEVMQGTADFHHEMAAAVLPQPHPVFDDPTALDAAVDMLDSAADAD